MTRKSSQKCLRKETTHNCSRERNFSKREEIFFWTKMKKLKKSKNKNN